MLAAIPLLLLASADSPKDAIQKLAAHYAGLSSYSATIECHDASGLYPGDYVQTLKWLKPNRFELVVTKKSNYAQKAGQPGSTAPSFYSNGADVALVKSGGETSAHSLEVGPNTMPGWEVSGGLVLSFLMKSPALKLFFDPPEGFDVTMKWGPTTQWEKLEVKQLSMTMASDRQHVSLEVSLYLSSDQRRLIGEEYFEGGKRHWRIYRNAKENPKLPKNLGDHPK